MADDLIADSFLDVVLEVALVAIRKAVELQDVAHAEFANRNLWTRARDTQAWRAAGAGIVGDIGGQGRAYAYGVLDGF